MEEVTKQLFGLIKKTNKAVFEAIVDRDTLVTHDMPECPLLDGSLAYTEKHKLTLDLLHHNNTNERQVYIDIFVNSVRDFQAFLNMCRQAECVKLRNPPAQTHFTHIFGFI